FTHQSEEYPNIVFTADSDLSFSQPIPWMNGMIMTAPHHGSEANASAYSRLKNETSYRIHVNLVRSDGRFASRPGPSFLAAHGSKYCTLCRGHGHVKQD